MLNRQGRTIPDCDLMITMIFDRVNGKIREIVSEMMRGTRVRVLEGVNGAMG